MAKIKDEKAGGDDDNVDPSLSKPAIDRYTGWPKSLREKSFHEIWRQGGPGGLYSRAEQENKLGHSAPQPLSNEELAQLVVLCNGEPLPSTLRNILIRERVMNGVCGQVARLTLARLISSNSFCFRRSMSTERSLLTAIVAACC